MDHKNPNSKPYRYDSKKRFILQALFLIMFLPGIHAQQATVTLSANNESFQSIFDKIEKGTDYHFTYKEVILPAEKNISITAKDKPIEAFLQQLLAATNLSYKRSGNTFAIIPRPVKKTVSMTGVVKDKEQNPITGATVIVKNNAQKGTVTDVDGNFNINVDEGQTLVISYLGYESKEILIGSQKQLSILLEESQKEIDEVVVVGYRTVKKVSLTGSVSTIDMKQKENQPITNTGQALYNTPGLWINQAGAKPGQDNLTIRIRGINSLNETGGTPLVLLDGVEYDINEIEPSNIQSISILKDVSAAIYGSKAANGVILITSKKGSKGKPKLEYKGSFGVQSPTSLPNVVSDPILYMKLRNQAEINMGIAPGAVNYKASDIAEYEAGMLRDPSVYPASDWFDICMDNGYIQQHSLRLAGGTSAVTYTMGLGYTNQSGIFIANDDAQRYSYDLKLNAHISDRLNVSGSIQGNLRQNNEVGYTSGTVMGTIARGLPIFSDYHRSNVYGSTWLFTPGRNNIENPRMEVEQGFTYRDMHEFLSTLALDYKPVDNLTYYATGSFRKIDHFSKDFMPALYTIEPKTGDTKLFSTNAPRVKDWDSYGIQYTWSHRLEFEKTFAAKHNVHAMAGNDVQFNTNRSFQAFNRGFIDNTLHELNALKTYTNAQTTGSSTEDRIVSVYGRLSYVYNDKYFAEGTMRYDASSRLAPSHRWAFFPSVMLGWRIDKESFFNTREVDMLKLRASAGEMGSQSVSRYAYMMTLDALTNYTFGGIPTSAQAVRTLVDPELTWERTRAFNLGVDLSAFHNRLYFEGDLFYKRTYDILRRKSVPSQIGGLSGPNSNVGTVDNKGYEINLTWRDKIRDFSYGFTGSISYVKNEVVDIKGDEIISGNRITKEGYPINSFYIYEADGYYVSPEEIDQAQAVYGSRSALLPGYIKYVNQNGDNIINENDKIVVGNTLPEYTYSVGVNLGYKNFTLETLFQGVSDVNIYPGSNLAYPFYNGAGITWDQVDNSWNPQNPNPNAKYPLLTICSASDSGNNFIPSTSWLRNAAYFRMKNIQLTYALPQRIANKLKMEKVSLYISGQNLWTLTDFVDGDPEMTTTRGDIFEYPNLKTVSMGINLTF